MRDVGGAIMMMSSNNNTKASSQQQQQWRSSSFLCSIPEDETIETADTTTLFGGQGSCNNNGSISSSSSSPVAWVSVLRNGIMLVDIGEEEVQEHVLETAHGLLSLEDSVSWRVFGRNKDSVWKGLRFCEYEKGGGSKDDKEGIIIWAFCVVYNSQRTTEQQAKQFLQDRLLGTTAVFRRNDPTWRLGQYHSCQYLFAPMLQQYMEDYYYEDHQGTTDIDLETTDQIIQQNMMVLQSAASWGRDQDVEEDKKTSSSSSSAQEDFNFPSNYVDDDDDDGMADLEAVAQASSPWKKVDKYLSSSKSDDDDDDEEEYNKHDDEFEPKSPQPPPSLEGSPPSSPPSKHRRQNSRIILPSLTTLMQEQQLPLTSSQGDEVSEKSEDDALHAGSPDGDEVTSDQDLGDEKVLVSEKNYATFRPESSKCLVSPKSSSSSLETKAVVTNTTFGGSCAENTNAKKEEEEEPQQDDGVRPGFENLDQHDHQDARDSPTEELTESVSTSSTDYSPNCVTEHLYENERGNVKLPELDMLVDDDAWKEEDDIHHPHHRNPADDVGRRRRYDCFFPATGGHNCFLLGFLVPNKPKESALV